MNEFGKAPNMQEQVPCRLHVLLARDAPAAVVFRRGPSRKVCVIGWDRSTDTFTIGQWLKGRIYVRRSDISPDGKHLIYFAKRAKQKTPATESWTAISRTPHLKAIGLWTKGDSWNGGGLFVDEHSYWINDGYGHETIREPYDLTRSHACPEAGFYSGECPGVYYPRLQRDGWRWIITEKIAKRHWVDVFAKSIHVGWVLRKRAHIGTDSSIGKGSYYDEHELIDEATGQTLKKSEWEWADLDRDRHRLVWCEAGKLYAGKVTDAGINEITELYDFNPMQIEAIKAPY